MNDCSRGFPSESCIIYRDTSKGSEHIYTPCVDDNITGVH